MARPCSFGDDPSFETAIANAESIVLDDVTLRFIRAEDLLHEKLRAGSDPSRRRLKRLQDLLDAEGLLEEHPELAQALTADERALLERLP